MLKLRSLYRGYEEGRMPAFIRKTGCVSSAKLSPDSLCESKLTSANPSSSFGLPGEGSASASAKEESGGSNLKELQQPMLLLQIRKGRYH